MVMLKSLTACAFFFAMLVTSCQEDPEPSSTLFSAHWKLDRIGTIPLGVSSFGPDHQSYLEFKADNSAQGLATCTSFTSKVTHNSKEQQLSFGPLSLDTPTCTSPVMAARYLAALPTIVRYEVSANTLRLYDAQNAEPQLVFVAE